MGVLRVNAKNNVDGMQSAVIQKRGFNAVKEINFEDIKASYAVQFIIRDKEKKIEN